MRARVGQGQPTEAYDGGMRSGYEHVTAADATVAQVERAELCRLFDELGPDAATLSGDWDTHHLAAHLRVREASPLGAVKMLRPRVANAEVEALVREGDFAGLVDELRAGPPRLSAFGPAPVDRKANALEFFIHHEDVRRAQPGWTARELPRWAEDQLWRRIRLFAKVLMRSAPVGVELQRSDTGETAVASKRADRVVVRGLPSEISLFAYGRSQVARVELSGSPTGQARLRGTSFGL